MAAIKMLSATWVKDPEALRRFYREAEAAAKLSHPNVVTIYDASEKRGLHFLVMEFVDGFHLAALGQGAKVVGIVTAKTAYNTVKARR